MLGAIIGDIVGCRWEFDQTNDYMAYLPDEMKMVMEQFYKHISNKV